MILVCVPNCRSCNIARSILPSIRKVTIDKQSTSDEMYNIKKALGKLNTDGKFPVVLDDGLNSIVMSDILMSNLNIHKLERLLKR